MFIRSVEDCVIAVHFTPKEAALQLGVSVQTLRRWEAAGKIQAIRTPSGQRRYDIASYEPRGVGSPGAVVAYARVSSRGQKADLDRQVATLVGLYPQAQVITDIASGLNFRRQGLRTVLERVMRGSVSSLVVAHRDRLCRFGFDLIKWSCEFHHCQVVVLHQDNLSPERELVSDLRAIVHVFSCRLYGRAKIQTKNQRRPRITSRTLATSQKSPTQTSVER